MYMYVLAAVTYIYMFLMRDEKEERRKQARSNKQGKATQHTHNVYRVFSLFQSIIHTQHKQCSVYKAPH